jgi:hypothetical protein
MGKQITRAPASRRVWVLIVLLAWTIAEPIQAAPQAAYERIVVLGTSLSDRAVCPDAGARIERQARLGETEPRCDQLRGRRGPRV